MRNDRREDTAIEGDPHRGVLGGQQFERLIRPVPPHNMTPKRIEAIQCPGDTESENAL